MIAGIKNIENEISGVLKKFDITDNIEIRYSNISGVDLQCNNLVRYSNNSNLPSIKTEIILVMEKNKWINNIEISDKNFINMTFSTEYFFEYSQLLEKHIFKNNNNSVIFDYGGPNIGKDLHVGHIRTLNIGRSLYNIFKLSGYEVISDIHFGDWGMPVSHIIAYIEHKNLKLEDLSYEDLEVIYPKANQLSQENKDFYELAKSIAMNLNSKNENYISKWRKIYDLAIPNIKTLLNKLGHNFDWYFGESDVVEETNLVVLKAVEEGR